MSLKDRLYEISALVTVNLVPWHWRLRFRRFGGYELVPDWGFSVDAGPIGVIVTW